MNRQTYILSVLRHYYSQSSMVDLRKTKQALERLYQVDLFKNKTQPLIAYQMLRLIIKKRHTYNCRFLSNLLLFVDHHYLIDYFHNSKWTTIDKTIILLSLSLKS